MLVCLFLSSGGWVKIVVGSWKQLAALVEATAPPVETIFTAEVRLEVVHVIGQDSPWVLARI